MFVGPKIDGNQSLIIDSGAVLTLFTEVLYPAEVVRELCGKIPISKYLDMWCFVRSKTGRWLA